MTLDDRVVRNTVLGFMSARCDVRSQHKLPSREEVLATHTARFIGVERVRKELDDLLKLGVLVEYDGGYISDRSIEVM